MFLCSWKKLSFVMWLIMYEQSFKEMDYSNIESSNQVEIINKKTVKISTSITKL